MTTRKANPATGDGGAAGIASSWNDSPAISGIAARKQDRPVYRLTLRPEPGVTNPARALRHALKRLHRSYGLRAVSVEEVREPTYDAADDLSKSIQVGFEAIRARVKSGGKGWGRP